MITEYVARQANPARFSEFKRVHHAWMPAGVDLTYGRSGGVASVQAVHVIGEAGAKEAATVIRRLGFSAFNLLRVQREADEGDCKVCRREYGWNLDCPTCLAREKAPAVRGLANLPFELMKTNEELQIAFGWFYVVERGDGTAVVDQSKEISALGHLEKAGYGYVLDSRKGGVMHEKQNGETVQVGRLAEFMVSTPEKKALWGITGTAHKLHTGLWGGIRIDHAETWAKTKAGLYPQFSIGGWARITELN